MKIFTRASHKYWLIAPVVAGLSLIGLQNNYLESSSHREAPIIANDPLADNTDVYAFRNPNSPNNMVIIANFIPFQHPHQGPNYYNFGENIAYDIHIKNKADNPTMDDIMYRYEFTITNEDPTTFFKIRLGKENQKATYTLKKSMDGGNTFTTIITGGKVPPTDIGPRSIEGAVGLNKSYDAVMKSAIMTASSGEKVFAGPVDDPFFVDIGGIADLGNIRPDNAIDGLRKQNVHSIVMEIPIKMLQKDGKEVSAAKTILDSDYVIGVWASASRRQMSVRNTNGTRTESGPYVQVSRLGMPLTNEAIIPIGDKDEWNATPSSMDNKKFEKHFVNPELALYMDDSKFGGAVPGLAKLRIQTKSLGKYDFRNGKDGLYPLLNTDAVKGTALDPALFGNYLLRDNEPRSVDILPIFNTGVPNMVPFQLVTGKDMGNPLTPGKPFINNFLPTFGDMLRVNMAVPPTPRNSPDFSPEGLVAAAGLGIADPRFNMTPALQFIPNMDGFPNGRRLEDDVTRIELQTVGGAVLAAIGLGYDDYDPTAGTGTLMVTQREYTGALTIAPPAGAVITGIQSATFGSGTGSGESFTFDANCQIDVTAKVREFYASSLMDLDPRLMVRAEFMKLGDPCPGVVKTLRVVATYKMAASIATPQLASVLSFTTGVEKNDAPFQSSFPYLQKPWDGFNDGHIMINCDPNGMPVPVSMPSVKAPGGLNLAAPAVDLKQLESFPNPANQKTTFRYRIAEASDVTLTVYNAAGQLVATPVKSQKRAAGVYEVPVDVSKYDNGIYFVRVQTGKATPQTLKFVVSK